MCIFVKSDLKKKVFSSFPKGIVNFCICKPPECSHKVEVKMSVSVLRALRQLSNAGTRKQQQQVLLGKEGKQRSQSTEAQTDMASVGGTECVHMFSSVLEQHNVPPPAPVDLFTAATTLWTMWWITALRGEPLNWQTADAVSGFIQWPFL